MNKLLGVGKALAALFWGAALANLLDPFAQPFASLLYLASASILLVHGLELWLFNDRLSGCPQPRLERVQVALFGVFHLLCLPPAQDAEPVESELQLDT
jgi:putative membrane protein